MTDSVCHAKHCSGLREDWHPFCPWHWGLLHHRWRVHLLDAFQRATPEQYATATRGAVEAVSLARW